MKVSLARGDSVFGAFARFNTRVLPAFTAAAVADITKSSIAMVESSSPQSARQAAAPLVTEPVSCRRRFGCTYETSSAAVTILTTDAVASTAVTTTEAVLLLIASDTYTVTSVVIFWPEAST